MAVALGRGAHRAHGAGHCAAVATGIGPAAAALANLPARSTRAARDGRTTRTCTKPGNVNQVAVRAGCHLPDRLSVNALGRRRTGRWVPGVRESGEPAFRYTRNTASARNARNDPPLLDQHGASRNQLQRYKLGRELDNGWSGCAHLLLRPSDPLRLSVTI